MCSCLLFALASSGLASRGRLTDAQPATEAYHQRLSDIIDSSVALAPEKLTAHARRFGSLLFSHRCRWPHITPPSVCRASIGPAPAQVVGQAIEQRVCRLHRLVEAANALLESPELRPALRVGPMLARQTLGGVIYGQRHRCGKSSERQRRRMLRASQA